MKKLFAIVLCLALCLSVMAITASAAGTYYVAGYPGLCNGKEWDPGAAENAMSDPDGDGIYSITYTNVAAGSYQFKVTDGTWSNCWPGSNYELTLDTACDVTIHFNSATAEITVEAAGQGAVEAPTFETISVIGTGIEALGNWDTDIAMTEISTGVYEYTFENVPAGSWPNLKFRANNAWDHNFGCADGNVGAVSGAATDAAYNGNNIWFEVAEASNVTLKLDLTAFDYSTKSGAVFTVTVAPVSAEPETPVEPDEPAEPEVPAEDIVTEIYVGDGTAKTGWSDFYIQVNTTLWGGTIDPACIVEGGYLEIVVSGTDIWSANLALNGNGWNQFDMEISTATDNGDGTYSFILSYEDLVAKYGADFSTVGAFQLATNSADTGSVTVNSIRYVVPAPEVDDSNPKDGDSIAVVFALLAVSAAGIAVVAKKKEF